MTTASPTQARSRKRTEATVSLAFPNGQNVSIKEPSIPAWLSYGERQGMEVNGLSRTFTDSRTRITVTLGAKR